MESENLGCLTDIHFLHRKNKNKGNWDWEFKEGGNAKDMRTEGKERKKKKQGNKYEREGNPSVRTDAIAQRGERRGEDW